jgi:hypothetical protein
MNLSKLLSELPNDAERYALLFYLDKEVQSFKKSIKPNILRNFRNYKTLRITERKVFKIDSTSEIGKDIQDLKDRIKCMEDYAKAKGYGEFVIQPSIKVVSPKTIKEPEETKKPEGILGPPRDLFKEFFF